MQGIRHGQHHVAIRHPRIERPPDVGDPLIHVHLAAGEAEAALTAEGHPLFLQAVRAQIRGIARLRGTAAEHLVDDGLHVAILVPRMALLEGLPVIAEDLLEGVFVDPLPCGDHSACLYHVLAPRATRLCPLIRLSLPIICPCRDGQKGDSQKRKFLDARVNQDTLEVNRKTLETTQRTSQETLKTNQETLKTTQQWQITERFTKAIEQL